MKVSSLLVSAFLALASAHYVDEEPRGRYAEPPENHVRSHHKTDYQDGPRVHQETHQQRSKETNNLRNNGSPKNKSPRSTNNEYDVVIVGSGMAGLSAAYDLKAEGWSVKILEAKDRHGGRIYKNDMKFDIPIDIGAEWVHLEAATRDGVSGGFTHPNQLLSAITGKNPSQTTKKDPDDIYIWSPSSGNERQDSGSQDWRWVGSTWYDFMKDEIMDEEDIEDDIMLNCPVDHIWYGTYDEGVEVYCTSTDTGTDHTFYASFVIVTIPMNLIQESLSTKSDKLPGSITFEPTLPSEYKTQADKFKMGPGIKVWLEFDRTFWKGLQAMQGVETNNHIPDGNHQDRWGARVFFDEMYGHPTQAGKKHVIGMFAHGTGTASVYIGMSDQEIINGILKELGEIYGVNANDFYKDNYFIQHWSTEKYISTGYTQYAPESAMTQFQDPVNDVVYFAGEAIPPDSSDWGFAHAAAQSGKSAANYIMAGRRF